MVRAHSNQLTPKQKHVPAQAQLTICGSDESTAALQMETCSSDVQLMTLSDIGGASIRKGLKNLKGALVSTFTLVVCINSFHPAFTCLRAISLNAMEHDVAVMILSGCAETLQALQISCLSAHMSSSLTLPALPS